MELSLIDVVEIDGMEDSFLALRSEAMDNEVAQIFKKWKLNNPLPKTESENINTTNQNGAFDSRTFTRPSKRKTFSMNDYQQSPGISTAQTETQASSMESGIASINPFQLGGALNSMSMQRSWLNDVSPPGSICTSMDFQHNDNMLNSLVTSSDFTNVSFLLNGNDGNATKLRNQQNCTMTVENFNMDDVTPTRNLTSNLMDFTFNINKTVPREPITNSTFTADVESPLKEYGIENLDFQLNDSTEDIGKNLTYNAYNNGNLTWDKIQDHQNEMNKAIVQSTPIHANNEGKSKIDQTFSNHALSPISSLNEPNDDDEDVEVMIRSIKSRRLINDITIEDYRNSIEDHSEFLLNEETIKLSSRVRGERLENIKSSLITSTDVNEKEFDEMLNSFNVKKSTDGEKLLQSVDNIKQRHSLINFEKQREDKQRKDIESDNKSQYETMNKSSERLLNRRSRLYDDVNLQLQKQQMETSNGNGSAKSNNSINDSSDTIVPEPEDEVIDKNNRDRFKTIKLNKKPQSGMVIIDSDEPSPLPSAEILENDQSTSPGSNKERRNQINQQQKFDRDETSLKKPVSSGLPKFGFARPAYRSRNDLNLPLKANSTDSLDNDDPHTSSSGYQRNATNLKSPMGIKSKSIHNLMYGGAAGTNGMRMVSNLKLVPPGGTKSQSNLKAPRASSLVRPGTDLTFKAPLPFNSQQPLSQMRATNGRKTTLVRPSSAYCGNVPAKRNDSDTESGRFSPNSLSSSSASSRNSVHLSLANDHQIYHQNSSLQSTEDLHQVPRKTVAATGTIPKPSGLRPPSNLRAPQARSGLPRPSGYARR